LIKGYISINQETQKEEFNDIIRLYKKNACTTLLGKSIFETMFYFNLGEIIKSENSIALGFDRDHHLYQTEGFKLGYSGEIAPAPLIYARRTKDEKTVPFDNLNNLSFRQFWR
jgi:hypothetical protein